MIAGMAPAEQQLTFRKQVLEDAQTLEYYGIKRAAWMKASRTLCEASEFKAPSQAQGCCPKNSRINPSGALPAA